MLKDGNFKKGGKDRERSRRVVTLMLRIKEES